MRNQLLATAAIFALAFAVPAFAQQAPMIPNDQTTGQMQRGTTGAATVDEPSGQPAGTSNWPAPSSTGQTGDWNSQSGNQTMTPNGTAPGDQTTGQIQRGTNGAQTIDLKNGQPGRTDTAWPASSATGENDNTTGQLQHGTSGASTVDMPNGQPGATMVQPPASTGQINGYNSTTTSQSTGQQQLPPMASTHYTGRPGHEQMSDTASNIVPADTRSDIAPALPVPPVGPNATPEQYLRAAQTALDRHQSGEAQEALERAETRLLDRSTSPDRANAPDERPRIRLITQALDAIGHRDWHAAHQAVDQALTGPQLTQG
jgi:hypothetical protein